jgi:hypothetical protein
MNKTYLSKLIEQETINVKIQLIKEHIEIARGEHIQLLENAFKADRALLSEQTEEDKTTWPAATIKTQEFLKNIPGTSEETRGTNLVAYDVTVTIPASGERETSYKNLFTFYEDGAVYDFNLMGRFGYKYDESKKLITIMSKNPAAIVTLADNNPLATIDATGKFTNLAYAEQPKSTFDKPKEIPWLDTLQTVLDFAGLIPVIGDALDLINAVIYFWREKYFEGFLSLIAIIPVVGSVISLGVKGAFKGIKTAVGGSKILSKVGASNLVGRWWLKGDPKAIKELADKLLASGALTVKQLRDIEKAFGSFGNMLKKAGKGVPDIIPGGKSVAKALDDAGTTMITGQKGFDKAIKAAAKVAPDVEKVSKTIWKTPKAVANFLTGGLLPKIKKMPFFPTKQLAAMGVKTEERFIAKSIKSPERLAYLTKFGGVKQRRVISKEFGDIYKSFLAAGSNLGKKNAKTIDDVMNANSKLSPRFKKLYTDGVIDWDGMLQSATSTQDFMTSLSKADPELAQEFGKIIADQAVANNNILWNTFKESTANKIISSQTSKVLKTSFAKNVDWIWNEMQMAGETLGFESSEHLGKVGIVPLAKWAVASSMPGTYASMQATRDAVVGLSKAAKDTLNVAANAYGIQLSDMDEYPPLGAEQYTYKQGEE